MLSLLPSAGDNSETRVTGEKKHENDHRRLTAES